MIIQNLMKTNLQNQFQPFKINCKKPVSSNKVWEAASFKIIQNQNHFK